MYNILRPLASEIDQRILAEDLLVVSGKSLNPEAWVGSLATLDFLEWEEG